MDLVGTSARRAWRHLSRSRARSGWFLALVSILIYGTYHDDWAAADAVRQAAIVLASVAFGAVFLPELSSNLWSIAPDDVRGLIPTDRVHELQVSLLQSQCANPAWAEVIMSSAVRPLLQADEEHHLVVSDVSYSIAVHIDRTITLGDRNIAINVIETQLRGRREIPSQGTSAAAHWIAIARDFAALREEFGNPGCLAREVAVIDDSLSDDEWRELIIANCAARAVVDGVSVVGSVEPPDDEYASLSSRVVRWFFVSSQLAVAEQTARPVTISFDFIESSAITNFPVMFSSYYIMGGLQLTFRIYGSRNDFEPYDLKYESYMATALPRMIDEKVTFKPHQCTELSVIVADSGLIWPGSGVFVHWEGTNQATDPPKVSASRNRTGVAE